MGIVEGVDARSVLVAEIGALAVEGAGIVDLPELVENLGVGDLRGVEFDDCGFSVTCVIVADFFVCRVFGFAGDIADGGCGDARGCPKVLF